MFHLVHRDTEVEINRLLRVFRISHDTSFVKGALLNANLLDDPHKRIVGRLAGHVWGDVHDRRHRV